MSYRPIMAYCSMRLLICNKVKLYFEVRYSAC